MISSTMAMAAVTKPNTWDTRMGVLKKYRLSVRRPSMKPRPTPYQAK